MKLNKLAKIERNIFIMEQWRKKLIWKTNTRFYACWFKKCSTALIERRSDYEWWILIENQVHSKKTSNKILWTSKFIWIPHPKNQLNEKSQEFQKKK